MPVETSQFVHTEKVLNKYGDVIQFQLIGAAAATAGNYTTLPFIAPHPIEIVKVQVAYSTASTSGTLQIEKLVDGEAVGTGANILASTIDLASTADTTICVKGSGLTANRQLKENDRIALVDGGTITNLVDLVVSIYYKPLGRGDYR